MESLRLRLEFKNSDILSHAQKSRGMEKTWILLQQPLTKLPTVAALSAHILHHFHLRHSCPHGLRISMDGYTLQSFLPINMLKDNDVISVQKIDRSTVEGNEEFGKEREGYEIEDLDDESAKEHGKNNLEAIVNLLDENKISSQRKLHDWKKKQQRSNPREIVGVNKIPQENEVQPGKKSKFNKRKLSMAGDQITGRDNARPRREDNGATNVSNQEVHQPKGPLHWKQFGGKNKIHANLGCYAKCTDSMVKGSSRQVVDMKRYKSLPEVCKSYSLGLCHWGSGCSFRHPEPGMIVGPGPTSQLVETNRLKPLPGMIVGSGPTRLVETSRSKPLPKVCRNYAQGNMQKNNNLDVPASQATPKHADGGPFGNKNHVTPMSFGSNDKCSDPWLEVKNYCIAILKEKK